MKIYRHLNYKIPLTVSICLTLLIQAITFGMQLKGGDIDANPGLTYNLEKIVHGFFHQENSQLFDETEGIQCACKLATLINGDSFLRDLLTTRGNNGITLCFLFIEGFTTAIILLRNCYYLFDSHSCDERDLSVVDGTSVSMKFSDLYELEKYFQVVYSLFRI